MITNRVRTPLFALNLKPMMFVNVMCLYFQLHLYVSFHPSKMIAKVAENLLYVWHMTLVYWYVYVLSVKFFLNTFNREQLKKS